MKTMTNKTPRNDIRDLDELVRRSVKEGVSKVVGETMSESYVAEPKQFKQVTEFVSQKTKDSHISLYKKYVETLNEVSAELDTADRTETSSSHSMFRSCKLDEAYNLNAVWLHELYFSNCFDPHSEIVMDSLAYLSLQKSWGTFDDWQRDFMACAFSAGNGWAVCGYNLYLKNFVNAFVSNHSQDVMMGFYPVIVVDMWEHAYAKDYGTDKKSYLISQMKEINWAVVEERVKKAKAMEIALK